MNSSRFGKWICFFFQTVRLSLCDFTRQFQSLWCIILRGLVGERRGREAVAADLICLHPLFLLCFLLYVLLKLPEPEGEKSFFSFLAAKPPPPPPTSRVEKRKKRGRKRICNFGSEGKKGNSPPLPRSSLHFAKLLFKKSLVRTCFGSLFFFFSKRENDALRSAFGERSVN